MSKTNILPANSFYDEVAQTYNAHMTATDKKVREVVGTVFKEHVEQGNVLDFGGGTGLDLSWEINSGYKVFFLEPSKNMRAIAKQETTSPGNLIFMEDHLDFKSWSQEHPPFSEKMNGILANFAVLNCIKDIDLLFEKLSIISNKGCYLVATVLDTRLEKLFKNYSPALAFKRLVGYKIELRNKHPGIAHRTYLHTPKQYKKAASSYFQFVAYTPISFSNFALLILSAK